MPDHPAGLTGPAITVAGGTVTTLEQLRNERGMSRRALIHGINKHGHGITATSTVRNAEGGHTRPGPQLLTAWLLTLGQNPDQEVLHLARDGSRDALRQPSALKDAA
jgi:hypothetical protein